MRAVKQPKPIAECEVCHWPTTLKMEVNHRCTRTLHGRRCSGVFKAGLGKVWIECQSCGATGKVGTLDCTECSAFGWKLFR